MSDRHANSRIITIFRTGSFISRAQGTAADEYFSTSRDGIGSYFQSRNAQKVGTGLTLAEEELLMPYLIDLQPTDREFRKKSTEFFQEIQTDIPWNTGLKLEVGLQRVNDAPVAKDNLPINMMDFIRYKQALGHPQVAESKEKANGNQLKRFYIFDKAAAAKNKTNKTKEEDMAMKFYLQVKENDEQVEQMLILLGIDPRTEEGDLTEKLRELATTKASDFIRVFEAGEMEIRSWIRSMVDQGVLKKMGDRYVDPQNMDDEQTRGLIGNDIEETIYFFKDDKNSGPIMILKARLQDALARPVKKGSKKTVLNTR